MKCIVCDNNIRIDTLKQLFNLKPLLLCSRCSPNLILKSAEILYTDNDWIQLVIDRLDKGDIVLTKLFETALQKALLKRKIATNAIKVVQEANNLPYPWLEILVNNIVTNSRFSSTENVAETLFITVKAQEKIHNQLAIVG